MAFLSNFFRKNIKSSLADSQINYLRNFSKFIQLGKQKVYLLILGQHPNNTIFSFNFHNVNHISKFLNTIKISLHDRQYIIADIGAGRSPYYEYFAEKVLRYIAIDRAESLPKNESRAIEQLEGFAEKIPLEDNSVDIVLCNQVLEHVNDPAIAVHEIYRILQVGGQFIGSVPHISPVHLEPYDFRRYTDLGIKQLLENAGFIDIKIEGSGGAYSAAALMISMDWMLTLRKENQVQGFSTSRALLLSPLVGLMNLTGIVLDAGLGNKQRCPSNLCWVAIKPLTE